MRVFLECEKLLRYSSVALVLALLLFPISLQWETTTKQARMLCYLLITLVFYVAGLFSWELPVTSSLHSFPTVKHGCAKLFGKTFQEQENGAEVTSRLGLLQKTGPGPIHSQGTIVCYYADQSSKNDQET